ncbi:Cell adhesion molecule 2 [Paragonimus heterotremus]|uniref:Cell adhesion molecule 2 n=1 Tax=Paragonimus heterotremus TaxID=100268 RepID=A0A8J4WIP9_9TREM|nr:Cell adhesion molecule 2 [Paragonimus heterotremus]
MTDVQISPTEQIVGLNGALVARSNLTVVARRANNGRRFECTALYLKQQTLLHSEEILEVKFSPNNVRLIAQPLDGVREANRLELTCSTSSCHPPAIIRWFEIPPTLGQHDSSDNLRPGGSVQFQNELTDLAQLDSKPGEFGGSLVSSKLTITKTYRSNQNTVYRCQVEHAGLGKPIINEHRLRILYPSIVKLISLPSAPVVGQTVLLSCQATGGNPQNGLTYSWFTASRSQLTTTVKHTVNSTEEFTKHFGMPLAKVSKGSTEFSSRSEDNKQPALNTMVRLTGHQDSQLNLTKIQVNQRGWYACVVSSAGGESQAFLNLDLLYQPMLNDRTKSQVSAHLGESVSFVLFIDANPPWAEAKWFQLNSVERGQKPTTHQSQFSQLDGPYSGGYLYNGYDGYPDYGRRSLRTKRKVGPFPKSIARQQTLRPVGTSGSDRRNVVAERVSAGGNENLTFALNFYEVREEDFGAYVCQIYHQLGIKDFHFYLSKKPDSEGIPYSSINVIKRGHSTVVQFKPPHTPYTRVVLRVCLRDAPRDNQFPPSRTDGDASDHSTSDKTHMLVYPMDSFYSNNRKRDTKSATDKPGSIYFVSNNGCQDYQVADPQSGQTEVRLAEAIQLYSFRLLLYRGTKLIQETQSVYWQPESAQLNQTSLGTPLLVLAVVGGCILFLATIFAAGLLIVYRTRKRKSSSFLTTTANSNNYTTVTSSDNRCCPSEDAEIKRLRNCGFEIRSDLGSVRSYQHSEAEALPLMQQMVPMSMGVYDPQHNGLPNSCSPHHRRHPMDSEYGSLIHSQHSATSNQMTNTNVLSNRIIAEAYLAAARAASAAVAASVISGSTDLYSPSTQMTGDLGSNSLLEANVDRDKQTSKPNTHFVKEQYMDGQNKDGGNGAGRPNEVTGSEVQLSEQRRHSGNPISSGNRGSRLSVQMGIRGIQPQWSNSFTGTSYSSLANPSQSSLEAAARAAAAAAVASVVQNMNVNFMMPHAASSNNLTLPYGGLPRPASRAASVAGPNIAQSGQKIGMESGDGESMHSVAFEIRYGSNAANSTGETTPTASLNHLDSTSLRSRQTGVVPSQRQTHFTQRAQINHTRSESGNRLKNLRPPASVQRSVPTRPEANYLQVPQSYNLTRRDHLQHRLVPYRGPTTSMTQDIPNPFVPLGLQQISHPTQQMFSPTQPQYGLYIAPLDSQPGLINNFREGYPKLTHPLQPSYQMQAIYPTQAQNPQYSHFHPSQPYTGYQPNSSTEPARCMDSRGCEEQKQIPPSGHADLVTHNVGEQTDAPRMLHRSSDQQISQKRCTTGATIQEGRGVGEGWQCVNASNDGISPSSAEDDSLSNPPTNPSISLSEQTSKGQHTTIEKRHHPGVNVCSSNLLISSKFHDCSSAPENGVHMTEDTDAAVSSLRRSPMGASFHVVSNGCALSSGSMVPVGNTTEGSICGDIGPDDNDESGTLTAYDYPVLNSVPGGYKQQPRLGVCSTTRVSKRVDRTAAINRNNKQLATKLTDNNSQTSIEPAPTTEGNHTVTSQPIAVPMSNGAKLLSQPQQ